MTNVSEFLDEFDSKLIGQVEMLCNFVSLVEIMLLFIRATWQGIWDLHLLASLEMFFKYFFFFFCVLSNKLRQIYTCLLI